MAEARKQKWELKFEQYKNMGLMDKKVEDLENDSRTANSDYAKRLAAVVDTNSEEYRAIVSERKAAQKETEKLKKIVENMPKIERLKNFRDNQQAKLQKLLDEKENSKKEIIDRRNLANKAQKLDEELKVLQEKKESLDKILNSPESTEKQKEDAKKALEENKKAQIKNQNEFSEALTSIRKKSKERVKEVSDKEIEATKTSISKCNFACRLLIEGKNMEDVQLSLTQWKDRKLTKPEPTKPEPTKPEPTKPEPTKPESTKPEPTKPESTNPEPQPPVPISEFDQKHPRLAAIKNWFIKGFNDIKTKITKKKEDEAKADKPEAPAKPGAPAQKQENPSKDNGKQTAEQMNARKAEFYKRLANTGKLSTMTQSGLGEAIKRQDETRNAVMNEDKGQEPGE